MRGKIVIKKSGWRSIKIKVRVSLMALLMVVAAVPFSMDVKAAACPNLRVVFARGSGGERWKDANYLAYKTAIESKLETTGLSYEFIDLDYPAVGIGVDKLDTTLGALVGSGEAYEFGKSVKQGVKNLDKLINNDGCPTTKYVLGGYSQGAMVLSRAISTAGFNADKLIYAATFGDPKLYLPEGAGAMPAACRGENLSDYRMYVPECHAYKGLLGANAPYEPSVFTGKVGAWCNKRDVMCSSRLSVRDHVGYVADDLYEDASKVIFDKICTEFGLTNTITSPHDTAILIDSTGSMSGLIAQYKAEALKLAERTLAAGGRVALYDYRDYQEGYKARQRCNFESCTIEAFTAGLNAITADGGGDTPESLLASSIQVMQELEWKRGAVKSVVVLTDAGYHDPDYDLGGTTRLDVVRLSKQIDPVNFYVITTAGKVGAYETLATETGGRVVSSADDLTELTEYIMGRYDALPRVEESEDSAVLPVLSIKSVEGSGSGVTVRFSSSSERILVILNDAMLGVVNGDAVTIDGLDITQENILRLVPLGDDVRGEGVEVNLGVVLGGSAIPKAPNTGRSR